MDFQSFPISQFKGKKEEVRVGRHLRKVVRVGKRTYFLNSCFLDRTEKGGGIEAFPKLRPRSQEIRYMYCIKVNHDRTFHIFLTPASLSYKFQIAFVFHAANPVHQTCSSLRECSYAKAKCTPKSEGFSNTCTRSFIPSIHLGPIDWLVAGRCLRLKRDCVIRPRVVRKKIFSDEAAYDGPHAPFPSNHGTPIWSNSGQIEQKIESLVTLISAAQGLLEPPQPLASSSSMFSCAHLLTFSREIGLANLIKKWTRLPHIPNM